MHIHIENCKPTKLQQYGNLYVTHFVFIDVEDEPLMLITNYDNDPISVFVARLNAESHTFEPIEDTLNEQIQDFIENNNITVFTLEQIEKEVEDDEPTTIQ